jgi:hypothetical protein
MRTPSHPDRRATVATVATVAETIFADRIRESKLYLAIELIGNGVCALFSFQDLH